MLVIVTLVVGLLHHGDHVETDKNHDADVKNLPGDKIKDHSLEFVLVEKQKSFSDRSFRLDMHFCVSSFCTDCLGLYLRTTGSEFRERWFVSHLSF